MVDDVDDAGLDFRFWLKVGGVVIGLGIAAMIAFILIGWAWYSWGLVGIFLFIALVFLVINWIYDRRRRKQLAEDQALLSG